VYSSEASRAASARAKALVRRKCPPTPSAPRSPRSSGRENQRGAKVLQEDDVDDRVALRPRPQQDETEGVADRRHQRRRDARERAGAVPGFQLSRNDHQHARETRHERRHDAAIRPLPEHQHAEECDEHRREEGEDESLGQRQFAEREEERGGGEHRQHGARCIGEERLARWQPGSGEGQRRRRDNEAEAKAQESNLEDRVACRHRLDDRVHEREHRDGRRGAQDRARPHGESAGVASARVESMGAKTDR
jgi:hypothetical protein